MVSVRRRLQRASLIILLFFVAAPTFASDYANCILDQLRVLSGLPNARVKLSTVDELAEKLARKGVKPRLATNADRDKVFKFIKDGRLEFKVETPELNAVDAVDVDLRDIERSYQHNRGELLMFEDARGHLVGTAGFIQLEPHSAEIRKLYLVHEYQGSGIGQAAFEHLVQAAKDQGYTRLELETYVDMHAAHRLYESYGFRRFDSPNIHEPDLLAYELDLTKPLPPPPAKKNGSQSMMITSPVLQPAPALSP